MPKQKVVEVTETAHKGPNAITKPRKELNTKTKMNSEIKNLVQSSGFAYPVAPMDLPQGRAYLDLELNPVHDQPHPRNELGVDPLAGNIFEDGFVVEEDQTALEPTAPYGYQTNDKITRLHAPLPSLVFSVQKKIDSDAKLHEKIAIVRDARNSEEHINERYFYNLFTYVDAKTPKKTQSHINEAQVTHASQSPGLKYLFSRSKNSVSPGDHVKSDTFIPFEILYTRLCGNWKARREAYARDWLAYCNYVDQHSPTNPLDQFKMIPQEVLPQHLDNAKLQQHVHSHDGSHLLARDTAGNFSAEMGASFLHQLLSGYEDKLTMANLSRHIFKRWCLVAHAAASIEKESYSIKARFWQIPKVLRENKIELIYEMMPFWPDENTLSRIMKDNNVAIDVRKEIGAVDVSIAFEQWTAHMAEVFEAAMASANRKSAASMSLESSEKDLACRLLEPGEDKSNLILIGGHPQGYYRTWIIEDDMGRMVSLDFTLAEFRPFAKENYKTLKLFKDNKDNGVELRKPCQLPTTHNAITKMSLLMASNWPRCPTQYAVMGGSATDVAEAIWDGPLAPRTAEWLHRSAYSFGGNGQPDTSQTQQNLVFGTFEANTEMIRYEDYLKRMVRRATDIPNNPFVVELATSLDRGVPQEDDIQCFPWLVPYLRYQWCFDLNRALGFDAFEAKGNGSMVSRDICFDLFSRRYPMRYEVEVDEKFDEMLANGGGLVKAMVAVFLISKSRAYQSLFTSKI